MFPAKTLDAEALRIGITIIAAGTAAFLVSHFTLSPSTLTEGD
jgi:hypothetical protein